MRVHKKETAFKFGKTNNISVTDDQINYEEIYENVKEYLVFRISITTSADMRERRLAYLDVFEYMEQVQLKLNKSRGEGDKNPKQD